MEQLNAQEDDQRHALRRQLQQVEYEVERAFEQYNEVDPRNRLVAAELERRWTAKLEERERLQTALQERAQSLRSLSRSLSRKMSHYLGYFVFEFTLLFGRVVGV